MAQTKGRVIPAGKWGKQKMIILSIAVGMLLLAKGLNAHRLSLFPPVLVFNSQTLQAGEILLLSADFLLLLAVFWTVASGADYIINALSLF